jgi:hypothetical protein
MTSSTSNTPEVQKITNWNAEARRGMGNPKGIKDGTADAGMSRGIVG